MNIIDHGMWEPYTPANPPDFLPANVLYLQRVSDQFDWLTYVRTPEVFKTESVKFQALYQERFGGYVIGPAVYDPQRLFPRLQYVGEITDYTGNDPQADFGQKMYDPVAGTITDLVIPESTDVKGIIDKLQARIAALEGK
jgi:hypothetical protein